MIVQCLSPSTLPQQDPEFYNQPGHTEFTCNPNDTRANLIRPDFWHFLQTFTTILINDLVHLD